MTFDDQVNALREQIERESRQLREQLARTGETFIRHFKQINRELQEIASTHCIAIKLPSLEALKRELDIAATIFDPEQKVH
jgi:hypothetical protein